MLQKSNPKNDNIQVFIKDKLYPRSEAKISVFDSSVQGGDAVWEGLRVYPEGVVCLDKHLTRLQESAKTLAFTDVPSKEFIKKASLLGGGTLSTGHGIQSASLIFFNFLTFFF